jgi:hypothetical protein
MMKSISGVRMQRGYYFNTSSWEITHVDGAGQTLPSDGESFIRLWLPFLPVVALTMGALMIMFLPFIGFALTIGVAMRKAVRGVRAGVAELLERIDSPSRHSQMSPGLQQPTPLASKAAEVDHSALPEAAAEGLGAATQSSKSAS